MVVGGGVSFESHDLRLDLRGEGGGARGAVIFLTQSHHDATILFSLLTLDAASRKATA
jgi:hypothetical protein